MGIKPTTKSTTERAIEQQGWNKVAKTPSHNTHLEIIHRICYKRLTKPPQPDRMTTNNLKDTQWKGGGGGTTHAHLGPLVTEVE